MAVTWLWHLMQALGTRPWVGQALVQQWWPMLSWMGRTIQVYLKLGHELGSGERSQQQQGLLGAEEVGPPRK